MERSGGYSEDSALADALSKLELVEKENSELRVGLAATSEGVSATELVRLRRQNDELMKVNHQWDCEFRDLNKDFQQYRTDSQRALNDSKSTAAILTEEKSKILEKYQAVEERILALEAENKNLRSRLAAWEEREQERGGVRGMARSVGGGVLQEGEESGVPYPMVSFSKVKDLEEECLMLRHQLKTYHEDYAEEYKDRQRMNEEKQCVAVKHEAEVTSLKLQLERTRAELGHYTSEANRLSQQLRMKNQQEEEQYKKQLESQGYLTRSPGGHLPPMDPFVEMDEEKNKLIRRAVSGPSQSPRLLTRGVDIMQAYSSSKTPVHSSAVSSSHSSVGGDRPRSPVPILTDPMNTRYGVASSTGVLPVPPQDSPQYITSNGYSTASTHSPIISNGRSVSPVPVTNGGRSVSPVPIMNGRSVSPVPIMNGRSTSPVPASNGIGTHGLLYGRGLINNSSPSTSPYRTQPPVVNGGSPRLSASNGFSDAWRGDQSGLHPATQASSFR